MSSAEPFEIFLVATPGLEQAIADEARRAGFSDTRIVPGGVAFMGHWPDVWRANLILRGPTRVLARIAQFRALHLAQLDKRARKIDWAALLRPDVPVMVEAACTRSRIYHAKAAAARVAGAIVEGCGTTVTDSAPLRVLLRIEDDLATLSIDASGDSLHKRGFKAEVNRAPMRETMAAMFLSQCGFTGDEPLLDPMCGAGTFVIEAAEVAAGLWPGRERGFAFEHLPDFNAKAWAAMKAATAFRTPSFLCLGSDRDADAIAKSRANAERAGVAAFTRFETGPVESLRRPEGPPGLVIVNPPYGARLGNASQLSGLYRALGQALKAGFSGWRVGLITASPDLARATRLPFLPTDKPVLHGGTRIALYRTAPLP